jgi:hypothetical protein
LFRSFQRCCFDVALLCTCLRLGFAQLMRIFLTSTKVLLRCFYVCLVLYMICLAFAAHYKSFASVPVFIWFCVDLLSFCF